MKLKDLLSIVGCQELISLSFDEDPYHHFDVSSSLWEKLLNPALMDYEVTHLQTYGSPDDIPILSVQIKAQNSDN